MQKSDTGILQYLYIYIYFNLFSCVVKNYSTAKEHDRIKAMLTDNAYFARIDKYVYTSFNVEKIFFSKSKEKLTRLLLGLENILVC